jgi:hypothetical protein
MSPPTFLFALLASALALVFAFTLAFVFAFLLFVVIPSERSDEEPLFVSRQNLE